jgi:hypothetical protein
LRVFSKSGQGQLPVTTAETAGMKVLDPTTAKANEVNPFTGEGM